MHPWRPPSLYCHRRKVLPDLSREAACYLPRSDGLQHAATRHHVTKTRMPMGSGRRLRNLAKNLPPPGTYCPSALSSLLHAPSTTCSAQHETTTALQPPRSAPADSYLGHTPRLQDFKHLGYPPRHRGPTRPLKPFLR